MQNGAGVGRTLFETATYDRAASDSSDHIESSNDNETPIRKPKSYTHSTPSKRHLTIPVQRSTEIMHVPTSAPSISTPLTARPRTYEPKSRNSPPAYPFSNPLRPEIQRCPHSLPARPKKLIILHPAMPQGCVSFGGIAMWGGGQTVSGRLVQEIGWRRLARPLDDGGGGDGGAGIRGRVPGLGLGRD
ncbi:hypothetical protein BDP27DRAFT_1429609 [Rhodocollybia butyracea]|uniref:Uncharacterized protein n=1 Tax=Rhodocollybia butyracea TaxID=206335 RepID=A0A9P5P9M7_9AGAR|nr:hypothetical protein BDP27DRAFT_1429609 [Rhodocollybia butyracea]